MGLSANPYKWAAVSLLVAGGIVSLVSALVIQANWLTAFGLSMLILAFLLFILERAVPKLPPQFGALLLEAGVDNIASIIEELGIKEKAIYLPSSLAGGRPRALLPLRSGVSPSIIKSLPRRFIVNYGSGSEDVGLLVTTTGTVAAGMPEAKPGVSAAELEAALTSLLMGMLGVAGGVRVFNQPDCLKIEISNPLAGTEVTRADNSLGGPLASVVAAVVADALDKPVTINKEAEQGGKYHVELAIHA